MPYQLLMTFLVVGVIGLAAAADKPMAKPSKETVPKWKKYQPSVPKTPSPSPLGVLSSTEVNSNDDDTIDRAAVEEDKLKIRVTRQTLERRDYYPCMSCFQMSTREICTKPRCPEGQECDKTSRRCHKRSNTGANRRRSRPEQENLQEEEEELPNQPSAQPQPQPSRPSRGRVTRGSIRDLDTEV